jgi:hypothetical protein
MRKIMIALLIAMISITIALAGVKKGNIEKNFQYNITKNITKNYEATLGPYYQLWGIDENGNIGDTGSTGIGYRYGGGADNVTQIARNLVNTAKASFEHELITAFGGFNFNGGSDWERSSWPGRNTGIYDIKTGNTAYSFSVSEGDVNISGTATFNYRVNANVMQSPIVLDLNGDNKLDTYNNHYLPVEDINDYKKLRLREFDISNIGYKMLVEHIGANDGYLVKPKNVELTLKTGKIEADEMFGTAGGFSDGFQKLSLLDKNKDNKLTQEELKGLYVFIDKNMNFKVDKGELKSLSELGITEIGVNHNNYESYYIRNGKEYKMWDFWPITLDVRKVK